MTIQKLIDKYMKLLKDYETITIMEVIKDLRYCQKIYNTKRRK